MSVVNVNWTAIGVFSTALHSPGTSPIADKMRATSSKETFCEIKTAATESKLKILNLPIKRVLTRYVRASYTNSNVHPS